MAAAAAEGLAGGSMMACTGLRRQGGGVKAENHSSLYSACLEISTRHPDPRFWCGYFKTSNELSNAKSVPGGQAGSLAQPP
jgi:hypothetical protein